MPTYTIDMRGSPASDAWAEGASALAKALTPDHKAEAEAAVLAARADASYASAASSLATRDKTFAETAGINWEQGIRENLWSQFQNGDLTREDVIELGAEAGIAIDPSAALSDLGSVNQVLASNEPGATPESMVMPQLGAGATYNDTYAGFKDTQTNDNARWLEEQSAARAADTVEAIDPTSGRPIFVPREQAVSDGLSPILSETDAKGLSRQTAAPGQAPAFRYDGTGQSQQDRNVILDLAPKVANGTASPEDQMLYALAYNGLYGPKTEIRNAPDGTPFSVQVQPATPPGLPVPGAGVTTQAQAIQADQTQRNEILATQGGPTVAAAEALQIAPDQTVAAPAPAPVGAAPAPVGAAPAPVGAAPAPVGAAPAPVGAAPAPVGGNGVGTAQPIPGVDPAPAKPPTEAQARYGQYAKRIGSGTANLVAHLGYNLETGKFSEDGFQPGMMGDITTSLPGFAGRMLTGNDRELYETYVAQSLNPLIRADSGAAVPEGEYPRYYSQYIPQSFEGPDVAAAKLDHLILTEIAFQEVSQLPEFARAMADENYSDAQRILHAARDRIKAELGNRVSREPGASTENPAATTDNPAATSTAPVSDPSVVELPGGLIATKVNK